ncbi:MAG: tRNA epoxyqueuosine(34) reductase QueG [Candidatus Dormibacteraeota bacterium]|nr:tRNA epoxyqueuosine(34) reductase QueG [Candidatus Dormibacteraeota bacterium]
MAPVKPLPEARARALAAIDSGRMAGMHWMSHERIEAASDLGQRYPWARAVVALAWPYRPAGDLAGLDAGRALADRSGAPGRPLGRIAAYACMEGEAGRPEDYHEVMGHACDRLVVRLIAVSPGLRAKRFIDHGWAMDRPLAELAGVGFAGKNTTLLTTEEGSYVLLAALLLSAELDPSEPSRRDCGSCQACLPACPTGALVAPGVMDANRCISYLTIEHRGPIASELRPLMGTWIFGCDLCQEACPINQRLASTAAPDPGPSVAAGPVPFPDLVECLQLDQAAFESRFRGTAVWRTGREGLARNAAIALGNAGDPAAVAALREAARDDPDAVVREAARWAVGRLGSTLDE